MWSAPIEEAVLSEEIIQRLKWLQENSLRIRAPDTHSVVRSMDSARLDREIQRKIATDKFDEDDLVAAILHRAELPETFYKEVVSKVILYRDTHIEFKLQNGQIV